ncbi:MAG: VOC family protein, partial [Bradyrhizobium sp.]|nr:VOC family protein [Bradyrhizobium sp.]
ATAKALGAAAVHSGTSLVVPPAAATGTLLAFVAS